MSSDIQVVFDNVCHERDGMRARVRALEAFNDKDVPFISYRQKSLLRVQLDSMRAYLAVLNARLEELKREYPEELKNCKAW